MASPARLFTDDAPDGFGYRDDFLTKGDETALVDAIGGIEFSTFAMRGVEARRRVAFFGASYEKAGDAAPPWPDFLLPLRERVAAWTERSSEEFAMALVNEYRPGTPIGWHRDAPQYDIVVGISLLSACRMKFRPYRPPNAAASTDGPRTATHAVLLQPRSIYLLSGPARDAYEHHIPAVADLRYSITFRTKRG
jgi:hypothetical protein